MRRKNGLPIIYEKLCKRCQTPFKLTLLNSKHSYCSPKCRIDARRDNDKRSKDKAKGKLADPRPQVPLYKTVLVQSAYDNWNRIWDALMKINSPQLKKILLEIEVRIPL
jgi:PHP family Zn ribbon phosphoesterase